MPTSKITHFGPVEIDEPQQLPQAGTLVCISGLNSGAYLFTGARRHLRNWRILRFNTPGLPGVPLPLPFSTKSYAAHVAEHLNAMQPIRRPLVVLGHSLGGYAAQELARMLGDKLDRLILVSTSAGQPDTSRDIASMQKKSGQSYWEFSKAIGSNPTEALKPLFDNGWLEQNLPAYDFFLQQRASAMPDKTATLAQLSAGAAFSSRGWLHSLNVPTLVMHGASDILVSPESGQALASRIPTARFLELTQSGHFPMLEHPSFWAYVASFAEGAELGSPIMKSPSLWEKLSEYLSRSG